MNVYESCPVFTLPGFTLRLVTPEDAEGLLHVYSDPAAQDCFNADNCTSDFRYATLLEMQDCIDFWLASYDRGDFVRWTVLRHDLPVGTLEMFRRDDEDNGTGVLRLDLISRLETADVILELLSMLLPAMHQLFGCECILTKSTLAMIQRNAALMGLGFCPHTQPFYWAHRHQLG